MMSFRRGAHLAKRATAASACFGSGYLACWTQGREETVPQLLACTALASWAGLARGLRHLERALPESAEWPKSKLAKAEGAELRWLANAAHSCGDASRDLATTLLWRIVLRRVCDYIAEEGVESLAVRGLAPVPESVEGESDVDASSAGSADPAGSSSSACQGSGVAELVELLDTAAVAVAAAGCERELLSPLTVSLAAVVGESGPAWQKDLAPAGVLHVSRAALVASSWLAVLQRNSSSREDTDTSMASSAVVTSVEERENITKELATVWQALSQPTALPAARVAAKGRSSTEEAFELLSDVNARVTALQAPPPPPQQLDVRPLEEELPPKFARSLREAMRDGRAIPVKAPFAAETKSGQTGFPSSVGKLLEYAAWAVLVGGVVVMISADGLGFLSFHVVPIALRPKFQALLHQRAVRVEELLRHHDPIPEGSASNMPTGDALTNSPWDAQASYIQANVRSQTN